MSKRTSSSPSDRLQPKTKKVVVQADPDAVELHLAVSRWQKATQSVIAARDEWMASTMDLIQEFSAARQKHPSDTAFGHWLRANGFDHVGKDDRAALIAMGQHLELVRQQLEITTRRSVREIWHKEIEPKLLSQDCETTTSSNAASRSSQKKNGKRAKQKPQTSAEAAGGSRDDDVNPGRDAFNDLETLIDSEYPGNAQAEWFVKVRQFPTDKFEEAERFAHKQPANGVRGSRTETFIETLMKRIEKLEAHLEELPHVIEVLQLLKARLAEPKTCSIN